MKNQKGFTLVELLLVIALLSISVGVTTDILLSLVRAYNKTQVQNELEQSANFITQKIENELRNSKGIASSSSTSIELIPAVSTSPNITYSVNESENKITRQEGTGTAVDLIDSLQDIKVECINDLDAAVPCFTVIGGNPEVIYFRILLSDKNTNAAFKGKVPIENVVVLRNTY